MIDIPYLVIKPGPRRPDGTRGKRYIWQPSAKLRALGWLCDGRTVPLRARPLPSRQRKALPAVGRMPRRGQVLAGQERRLRSRERRRLSRLDRVP